MSAPRATNIARTLIACLLGGLVSTSCKHTDEDRVASLTLAGARPESFLPSDLAGRSDSAKLVRNGKTMDTDEDAQPDTLPPLPAGVTFDMIRDGDRIYRGKGGCVNCHGTEEEGLPGRGKTLTAGLHFIPAGDWRGVDSIVSTGVPDAETRSPIAMPPRGQHGDLDAREIREVAAYVWAVSSVRGEPWPGGHTTHATHDPRASARTAIP